MSTWFFQTFNYNAIYVNLTITTRIFWLYLVSKLWYDAFGIVTSYFTFLCILLMNAYFFFLSQCMFLICVYAGLKTQFLFFRIIIIILKNWYIHQYWIFSCRYIDIWFYLISCRCCCIWLWHCVRIFHCLLFEMYFFNSSNCLQWWILVVIFCVCDT